MILYKVIQKYRLTLINGDKYNRLVEIENDQ